MLENWQSIHGNQLSHQGGMVHCHSESDQTATIMSGYEKTVVAQPMHNLHQRRRLCPLGREPALRVVRGDVGASEPRQIRAYDPEICYQQVCDLAPSHMRAGMAMDQKQGRPRSAMPKSYRPALGFHHFKCEVFEHLPSSTGHELTNLLQVKWFTTTESGTARDVWRDLSRQNCRSSPGRNLGDGNDSPL
jgi:hypothetical protein